MAAIRSMGDLARVQARDIGSKAAVITDERTWTYAELDAESSQVAQGLLAAGVKPQDRVAFLDKNAAEYFLVLVGAGKVNAVTVAVNWRLAPPEIEYIIENSGAKVLVVGSDFLAHLAQISLPSVEKIIVLGHSDGYESWGDWIGQYPATDPQIPTAADDTAYQLYTSGTTGLPKGVELTNGNFFDMLPVGSAEWFFDKDSVNLVAMPLFHIAGSGWGVVGLFNGGTNVLLRDVDPTKILDVIPRYGITNALLVPAVLQILLAMPATSNTDFSTLRMMAYGASPISEQVLVGSMNAMGCKFIQAYGLTETTGGVSVLRFEDHDPGGPRAHLLRSAGRPWGDVELRIADPVSGVALDDGAVGEIWVKSIQNMKGYFANPDATSAAFPEGKDADGRGWFRTGDAGYMRDGYLYIHDRVKDMIVSGAENIYPAEIENALMSHPDIADASVIGIPDDKWGESVLAIITPRPGTNPTDEDIIAYCRERLAGYKCPRQIARMDSIPRNPSGKVLKTELRKPYWQGRERMVN